MSDAGLRPPGLVTALFGRTKELTLIRSFVAEAATGGSVLLLIVDDLRGLDRAPAMVLSFIARRLAGSHVGLLAASRSGAESFFERSGLPMLELQPLEHEAAAALLSARFPSLAPRVHQRLL